MTDKVLLLTPSRGLGGGIERYAATVEWVLQSSGLAYRRMDLQGSGLKAYATLLMAAQNYLKANPSTTRLILAHRALLPLAVVLNRQPHIEGTSVLFHGSDVWNRRRGVRQLAESRAMRYPGVRAVAVSNYTAGALSHMGHATVVPPGLANHWYQTLVEARRERGSQGRQAIVTAFRLAAWKEKGLPEIVSAVASLDRPDLSLVICGTGEAPRELRELLSSHTFCHLRVGLSDSELASQFAAARVFVLATRMRGGRRPCGEGYGIVLQEAQLAGAPVVAPAYGGSHEAFVEGVTGVAPVDEKAETLANVLRELLGDAKRLAKMGNDAAAWAYESLSPVRYSELVLSRLM
ncbi:MAG TPA: glycosyltransferase family 4 protein [Streptosporangiaceae bacterium]|nr:glycosyltransferase family 4 protein [Streptosporangiaceae bacterium]